MTRIIQPVIALPGSSISQQQLLKAIADQYSDLPDLDKHLRLIRHTTVEQRHFVVPLEWLFHHAGVGSRSHFYIQAGLRLASEAIQQVLALAHLKASDIDHLLLVSCTAPAVLLPGLDAHLVNHLDFRPAVRRLPIAQMGCHGGATALAQAHEHVLAYPEHTVLVCALELPSLNEQPHDRRAADFVSRGLFGDGCAAVIVQGDRAESAYSGPVLRVLDTGQYLVPQTVEHMRYTNDHLGNHFATNRAVVVGLKKGFPAIHAFLQSHGVRATDLHFLVSHTGGPRVMDLVVEALGIEEQMIVRSRESLRVCGNLSSASVLDVLRRTFEHEPPEPGALGLLLAFGPGSTIEMALLQWQDG